jgi:DNA-binding XRE family transcriptional regulator
MTNRSRPKIRPETLDAVLERAGLTIASAARGLGMSRQALHAMVTGKVTPSRRVELDLPLLLGDRTGLDADAIRDAIFDGGKPVDHDARRSFLHIRLQEGAAHVDA